MIGESIGPYRVLERVGAGGMGEVYRARDTRLDRSVAIKLLPADLSTDLDRRARFEREARAVAALAHPHICTLYDIGTHEGATYLVMEHLAGETLADRLTKGPLTLAQALEIGAQVAEALDAAHKHGIVHRDLKPGNVMLTTGGTGRSGVPSAKLLDFGLAKLTAHGERPALATEVSAPTRAEPVTARGTVLGTLPYMAPEQLEGKEADARTDLWALGAILYEMVTGARAFAGDSSVSLIGEIMHAEPPALAVRQPLTPPALERLVKRCLAKHPDQRWDSAHDVGDELRWIGDSVEAAGAPVVTVSTRRRAVVRLAWIAAGLVLAAAALLAARAFTRQEERRIEPASFTFDAPASVLEVDVPRISPDGRYVAFAGWDSTRVSRIWLRPIGVLTAQPLVGTEGASGPFWSPDSGSIGFFADNKVKRVDVVGRPPRIVCEAAAASSGSWGRSGVILFTRDGLVQTVNSAGGVATAATSLDPSRDEIANARPHFLPDGQHFLYLAWTPRGWDSTALRLGRLGSKETRILANGRFSQVDFVAPGYLAYVRNQTLFAQPFDLQRLELTGEPVAVVDGVMAEGQSQKTGYFSFSTNGTLAYRARRGQGQMLVWRDRTGQKIGTLGAVAEYRGVALSPDERTLAASIGVPWESDTHIWLLDVARATASRFTTGPTIDTLPVWAADGETLYFWSDRTGPVRVYQKSMGASSEERELPLPPGSVSPSDTSSEGRLLACVTNRPSTGYDIQMVSLGPDSNMSPVVASAFNEREPRLSPDGKWLAYTSDESGVDDVYVVPYPGLAGKWQLSTGGGKEPQWRADGKELFYLTRAGELMSVVVSTVPTFRAEKPVRLFGDVALLTDVFGTSYAVTADGKRFLVRMYPGSQTPAAVTVIQDWASTVQRE